MNLPYPASLASGIAACRAASTIAFNRRRLLLIPAVALLLTLGCMSQPATLRPLETTKYTLENTESFDLVDPMPVRCTGLQEYALADGRLEVVANLKNLDKQSTKVQVACLFRNEEGLPTGEETPWQTVVLPESATEAVHFSAAKDTARKYTIRVRQPQ